MKIRAWINVSFLVLFTLIWISIVSLYPEHKSEQFSFGYNILASILGASIIFLFTANVYNTIFKMGWKYVNLIYSIYIVLMFQILVPSTHITGSYITVILTNKQD